jgi:hypothetical protein
LNGKFPFRPFRQLDIKILNVEELINCALSDED